MMMLLWRKIEWIRWENEKNALTRSTIRCLITISVAKMSVLQIIDPQRSNDFAVLFLSVLLTT
jgi:hypothetical protein